jgi:hypothetical protein
MQGFTIRLEGERKAADICSQDFFGIQFAVVLKAEEKIGGYFDERETRWRLLAEFRKRFVKEYPKTTEILLAMFAHVHIGT